jgi:sugar phosphate isomerase/epimerase
MRRDQIALQLYTVRDLTARDLPGTLQAVAAAGYRSVELAGLFEVAAIELRRLLGAAGLRPVAAHVGVDRLRAGLADVADRHAAIGCDRVIVPWLPEDERRTADGVRRFAAELNELAGRLGEQGIKLGYHNHAFEFEPLEGTTVWDVLLAELSPALDLELDVYWASVGGRNPSAVLHEAGRRIRLLHMKDRAPGSPPRDAPAGAGMLDFAEIVGAGRDAAIGWYVAEQDNPGDALADIARAYRFLESLAVG